MNLFPESRNLTAESLNFVASASPKQYDAPTMHVLIVEDDPLLVRIYSVRLKEEGFDVDIAIDGNEALLKVKQKLPDFILLDLLMPRKDGYSFMEDLNAMNLEKKPPVLVLTNLDKTEDMEKAKKLGVTDFVVKGDTNMDQIIERIRAHKA